MSNGDLDGALDLVDENVTWWLAGKPDQFEIAGTKNKAQFTEMLGTIETGMQYQNQYHDLLVVRGGKIVAGREYLDTAHAAEVIIGSARAEASAG